MRWRESFRQFIFLCSKLLAAEAKLAEKKDNPANIGIGCDRHCICELPGQLPCPGIVPLPFHMRAKHTCQRQ